MNTDAMIEQWNKAYQDHVQFDASLHINDLVIVRWENKRHHAQLEAVCIVTRILKTTLVCALLDAIHIEDAEKTIHYEHGHHIYVPRYGQDAWSIAWGAFPYDEKNDTKHHVSLAGKMRLMTAELGFSYGS